MSPEQMQARAVSALAEEFDRRHDDPHADAQRWIGRLMRSGWRPQPELLNKPEPGRRARGEVKDRAVAHAKRVLRTPHSDACTPEMRAEGQYAGDCRRCELIAAGIAGQR